MALSTINTHKYVVQNWLMLLIIAQNDPIGFVLKTFGILNGIATSRIGTPFYVRIRVHKRFDVKVQISFGRLLAHQSFYGFIRYYCEAVHLRANDVAHISFFYFHGQISFLFVIQLLKL